MLSKRTAVRKQWGTWRNLEEENMECCALFEKIQLRCCGKKISTGELWFLSSCAKFIKRKLYIAVCPVCNEEAAILVETRAEDGAVFVQHFSGVEAVKTIYRERKRKLSVILNVHSKSLNGWVYGKNIEIKNKKGEVIKIRQYASDFQGNQALVKVCKTKG